jgi:hypothetical protein
MISSSLNLAIRECEGQRARGNLPAAPSGDLGGGLDRRRLEDQLIRVVGRDV